MNTIPAADRLAVYPGQVVMPFYLLCDVSYSMRGDMAELNDGVRRLKGAMLADPVVDDVARFCILSFSDRARVVVPMTQLSTARIPRLTEGGGTNYGAAFHELARAIDDDSTSLTRQGGKLHRPWAFFITDGAPSDETWHQTFTSTLTDRPGDNRHVVSKYPVFVPFGFRKAPEAVLRQLAYPPEWGKWYHAGTTSVEQALTGILRIITQMVIMPGRVAWPESSDPSDPSDPS
jgi:uncharacterized protein YegL